MIDTRQPRIYRNVDEYRALGGKFVETGEEFKSGMNVPLMVGQEIKGMIHIANLDMEHAYDEFDLRLLTTLTNSMSVALDNARLFDETQRLLKETEQRAAEFQIINSVQDGLASKLDLQGIYDLVGDKIRDIFDARVVMIGTFHEAGELEILITCTIPRLPPRSFPQPRRYDRLRKWLLKTGKSFVNNRVTEEDLSRSNGQIFTGSSLPKSVVFIPLMAGRVVKGYISLQNSDDYDAFSESDVRLLQTLANSMSVALENARLFDETQRLFQAEREARQQAETLRSITHALNSSLTLSEVFDVVLTEIQNVIPYDSAAIFQVKDNRRVFAAGRGFTHLDRLKGVSFEFNPADDDIGYRVSRSLSPIILDDAMASYPQYFNVEPHTEAQVRSYMGISVIFGSEMIGMITLDKKRLDTIHSNMPTLPWHSRLKPQPPSIMPASSTRPNACSARPNNAPPNYPSLTASARRWGKVWMSEQ